MLVLRPIASGQSRYYLQSPGPGLWVGTGAAELGLRGTVDEPGLEAVLAGRQPGGGLLGAPVTIARRSGFDLILAAPKSVSLLAALADEEHRARFFKAHDYAVDSALGYLQREATWTRRGSHHTRTATTGLVAAAFRHSTSAALDPHLHTHVVVANLVHGDDGRWSCLDSRALYRHARAAGAVFQAALRYHLTEQGLRFDWIVNRHGLGDIVGVSRAAIDAASLRRRQVVEEIAAGLAGRVGRATAAGRTRRIESPGPGASPAPATSRTPDPGPGPGPGPGTSSGASAAASAGDQGWRHRVAAVGLDHAGGQQLIAAAMARRSLGTGAHFAGPDDASLARLLSEHHSQFRRPEVIRAAAALSIGGASVAGLETVADDFLKGAVPAGDDRWTTAGLRRLEERIVASSVPSPARAPVGVVAPDTPAPNGLNQAGRQALERLTRGGAPVDLLRGDLMSQARVLDAARSAWEASGHRVALVSPTGRGQARWQILAAVERPPPALGHPTVLLVDNAERWLTADLHRVMADSAARQAKVVLIEGGTKPVRRQAESPAVEKLRATLGPIDVGRAAESSPGLPRPAPETRPGPEARPAPEHDPPVAALAQPSTGAVVRAGRGGTVTLTPTGQAAVAQLVHDWHRRSVAGERPRMVALGVEEAEHLNVLARAVRAEAGELRGPAVEIAGRQYQAGDEVMALRRDARLSSVPGGTLGRVTALDAERQVVTIEWSGEPDRRAEVTAIGSKRAIPLTHGYATTPPYLRKGHDGAILSLGHLEAVAPRLHPHQVYEVLPIPTRARTQSHDPLHPAAAFLSQLLAELPTPQPPGAARRRADDVPSDARRPLSELAAQRDRLADHLRSTVPPDPGPELRRLLEERQWWASVPDQLGRYDRAAARAALDGRQATLTSAVRDRRDWLEGHRGQLERWSELSQAIVWREAALARGAEIRPTAAVLSELGPPPTDAVRRPIWRRAAAAIESHRERWALPDRPLELAQALPGPPGPDPTRRAGELRVLATTRELRQGPGRHPGRPLAPSGF